MNQQVIRVPFTVTAAAIAKGYGEYRINWATPLPAGSTYFVFWNFLHVSTSPGQSRLFTNNGTRDENDNYFVAVVGLAGAVLNDLLQIEATVFYT